MLEKITIENYKSIEKLEMELGKVNILIGPNGSGKSNILEGIAFGSAGISERLKNGDLIDRGIIPTTPDFMRSGFNEKNTIKNIKINFKGKENLKNKVILNFLDEPYPHWVNEGDGKSLAITKELEEKQEQTELFIKMENIPPEDDVIDLSLEHNIFVEFTSKFLIFSPQYEILSTFQDGESFIEPLGKRGEGLFKFLQFLSKNNPDIIDKIRKHLKLIDWFEDFYIPKEELLTNEKKIKVVDRYLDENLDDFDQKSSNEGFLFLLFYFTLFISDDITPNFFAIDNIDSSLNPKLCSELIRILTNLSKKYNKQIILTTHNPAVLDGVNLDDKDQKIFVVFRNKLGHTKHLQLKKRKVPEGQTPVRLSEQFLRGYIGGLPTNF